MADRCWKRLVALSILVSIVADCTRSTPPPPISASRLASTPIYWPTKGWRMSLPEQQGMDSEQLAKMVDYIRRNNINIHSILVIRNGYIVTEVYFDPFQPAINHEIYSAT